VSTKGTDDTVAEGTEDTIAPATQPRGRSADSALRTNKVGDAIKGANIQAFDVTARTRYQVLGELARGGLGRVLRARDPRTGRIVALKEVLHSNSETLARFAREALVTANLQHPSIVPVYEVGRWPDGEPFYAMKLVNGRTLNDVIARARTAEERVALLPHAIAVADALAYAHGEQVIHRDLKPNNVLVGPYGETVVIDWGLARNIATGEEVGALTNPSIDLGTETVVGTVMGTPAYMPPEQAHGAPLDEGADVYAIGAILYHMLAGQRPYADATTLDEIVNRVKDGPPRPLAELAPGAPKELVAIVEKAMARKLDERYRTAVFLAEDLRRFQSGKLVGAHQYTSWELTKRWLNKHRALITVGIFAFAALVAVGIVSVKRIARERDVADAERETAQKAEQLANERFEGSLEELARQAALAGSPERAIAFLSHVHHPTAAAGILRGQADAAYAGLVAAAPAPLKNGQSVDLTRDGKRLFVAGGDGKLIAWADGKIAWTADGALVQLSPDEQLVLAATGTKAMLYAAATGAVQRSWDLGEEIEAAAWQPSGARFALGGVNGTVAIATPIGELVAQPKHAAKVRAFAWRGDRLASASEDGTVHVDGASLVEGKGSIWSLAWTDDTHLVAGGADHVARLWNVAGKVEQRFDLGTDIYGVLVGSDWVAAFGNGDRVRVWPLAGGPARELVGHRLAVDIGAVAGDALVTADETGQVFAWDPRSGERLRQLPSEGLVNMVVARGPFVVLTGEGRTRVWRFEPEVPFRRARGATGRVRELAIAGDALWLTSNDGTARSFALATGALRQTIGTGDLVEPGARDGNDPHMADPPNPHGARVVVPRGDRVYVGYEDGRIAAGTTTWQGHTGRIHGLIFVGDVAYSAGDTTIRKWDIATGVELARVDVGEVAWALIEHAGTIAVLDGKDHLHLYTRDLAPGPAVAPFVDRIHELHLVGDKLLVGTPERLGFLDLATGAIASPAEHVTPFSSDVGASRIAIGDAHGEIALYDRALTRIRNWRSGDNLVTAVRLRPDGQILASASDKHVVLWDVATGAMLAQLPPLSSLVLRLEWSPDGAYLVASGTGVDAWIWHVAPHAEVDTACTTTWELADGALRVAPAPTAWCQKL